MERSCAQCPTATSRHSPVRKPAYLRRDTYTHPSVDTSSSQLRDYLGNIEKAGKGCQNLLSASPPRYQDSSCDPLPGTTNPASTQVVNRIIKELSYAANVVDHFTTLHTMQGQLFVVEGSELPALAANLQRPHASNATGAASSSFATPRTDHYCLRRSSIGCASTTATET